VNRGWSWFSRAGLVFLGYLAAVFVAVGVTVFCWMLPTVLPDDGALGSVYAMAGDLTSVYLIGLIVTFPAALPGFLAVVFLASGGMWERWLHFALAGAGNAVPSLLIFGAYMGQQPVLPLGLMLACLPGGFAGGYVYWLVAGLRLRRGDTP
jgi:hypothetical protein